MNCDTEVLVGDRMSNVIAIFCSDLHLSEEPPLARSREEDWFDAMRRPLRQLKELQQKYKVPVICAGDIFDRWRSNPAIINFAIEELPVMYAVPGQHDLPNHSYREIKRSAYWTLVEAGKIINLIPSHPQVINKGTRNVLTLHPFPWGEELKPCPSQWIGDEFNTNIAVVHKYIWFGENKHPMAKDEDHVSNLNLGGYDVIVSGDNHKGFARENLCNCGGFMRRKSDEKVYSPFVGLLHSDKTITQHFLDCSEDKFIEEVDNSISAPDPNMQNFIKDLENLSSDPLDFRESVRMYCEVNKVTPGIKEAIMEAIG